MPAWPIIVLSVVGEVPDGVWVPMMLVLFAGIVTTAAGIILGVVHLIEHHPHRTAG